MAGYSRSGRRRRQAYTLIEMLIAMIMFTLIMVATGFMMTTALRGQDRLGKQSAEAQEVRAILSALTRDLRSAYHIMGSPSTYLVASGADSGPILQFTTLTPRIGLDATATTSGSYGDEGAYPRSNILQVTYDYNPETHVLSRLATEVPDSDNLPPAETPNTIVSRRVSYITLRYVSGDGTVRNEWNLQNVAADQSGEATAGDTELPVAIEVELELQRSTREAVVFRTTIALDNPTVQPEGQRPAPPTNQPGTGGTPGTGGSPGTGGTPGIGGGTP